MPNLNNNLNPNDTSPLRSSNQNPKSTDASNYMSPLEKAANAQFNPIITSKSPNLVHSTRSFKDYVYEVQLAPVEGAISLHLPIDGGSDAGTFCVIGSSLDHTGFAYVSCNRLVTVNDHGDRHPTGLSSGDVILALDDCEIAGYTRRDANELLHRLTTTEKSASSSNNQPSSLRIRLCSPIALPNNGSILLSNFLATPFPPESDGFSLQERIRENVYQRVVPCTTRSPRPGEIDGVHYRFLTVPDFLALERSGQLLESGMYKGNHYGTPRPDPSATALPSVVERLSLAPSQPLPPTTTTVDNVDHEADVDDDSCSIPPPLPPLASLKQQPSTGGNAAPRPPLRHSSINTASSATTSTYTSQSASSGANNNTDSGRGSVDLGLLSPCRTTTNNNVQQEKQWSTDHRAVDYYFLDCDVSRPCHDEEDEGDWSSTSPDHLAVSGATKPIRGDLAVGLSEPPSPQSRPLPYGWEVVRDHPQYGTFYIDHVNKRTQYEPPTDRSGGVWLDANDSTLNAYSSKQSTVPSSRISPLPFTSADPTSQLKGPLVSTVLVKGPKGFGFTIVGGSDASRPGFLQVKNLVPGGPAALDNCLAVGDLLVSVNSVNVLGFSHTDLVRLLQSIPVGSSVQLTLCQAYHLPREGKQSVDVAKSGDDAIELTSPINRPGMAPMADLDSSLLSCGSSSSTSSSLLSTTANSNSASSPINVRCQSPRASPSPHVVNQHSPSINTSHSGRPEFLKVSICKQSTGFGFTLADHPQGQHVKAISDPDRCGRLRVGDVVVELNDQRVKELPHSQVVHLLKQCPVGCDTRILVQRGGLYTGPLNLKPTSDALSDQASHHLHNPSRSSPLVMVSQANGRLPPYQHPSLLDPTTHPLFLTPPNIYANHRSITPSPNSSSIGSHRHDKEASPYLLHNAASGGPYFHPIPFYPPVSAVVSAGYGSLPRSRSKVTNTVDLHPYVSGGGGEFLVNLHYNHQSSSGFGFSLTGGGGEKSPIVIGQLSPGGSAHQSGVIQSGDRLLSINGHRLASSIHLKEAVHLIEQAGHTLGQVTLGLLRTDLATHLSPQIPSFDGRSHGNRAPDLSATAAVEVMVPRNPKGDGFGFFVANGRHKSVSDQHQSSDSSSGGEYIAQLVPGSKAETLGLLSVGDRILAVNKISIKGMHHDQVVRLIRESGSHIVLTIVPSPNSEWASRLRVQRPPTSTSANQQQPHRFGVTLVRSNRGFGFSIRGGEEFNQMPLIVLRIAQGGAAQLDGRLQVGDELIEINGFSTLGMSHRRAIEIIQAGGNTMRLLVVRRHAYVSNRHSNLVPPKSSADS